MFKEIPPPPNNLNLQSFWEEKERQTNIYYQHPGNDKETVIREMFAAYPEESFSFLNAGKLKERVTLIQEYFLPNNPYRRIAYAVKANPRKKILEILNGAGIETFDCASENEIAQTLKVNPSAEILFNHPIKTSKSIHFAAENQVKHFTVQTQHEIEKVLHNLRPFTFSPPIELAVRLQTLNPKAKVNLSTKFGAETNNARTMLKSIHKQTDIAAGLSIHTGSQNTSLQSFKNGIRLMSNLAQETGNIKTLNIGGGLPVEYFEHEHFDLRHYLQTISHVIESKLPDNLAENPKLIIELGRALVADAIDLLIPILAIEERNGQKCVYFNDGIFTSFTDSAVHNWQYNFQARTKDKRPLSTKRETMTLFGRTCDSGDSLGEVPLPVNLQAGDLLEVAKSGAYLDYQSTLFNGFDGPKYVTYN